MCIKLEVSSHYGVAYIELRNVISILLCRKKNPELLSITHIVL